MSKIDLDKVYISCECNMIVDYDKIEVSAGSAEYKCLNCEKVFAASSESGEWENDNEAKEELVLHIIDKTI